MSAFPGNLPDQISWLVNEIAELKRRDRNRKRTGKISKIDLSKGLARVEFEIRDGKKYLSPWMPWKEIAAGNIKAHIPPSIGEQVDVVSETGDLGDGVIDMSIPSNQNARPHDGEEAVLTIGGTRIEVGSAAVIIKADKIVLKGFVHLGGEGGKLIHLKGDKDSAGDVAVGSASKVFAV